MLPSPPLLTADVDGGLARRTAFVYMVYASEYRMVYVGQTMAREGALQRLSQHLSEGESNTFRQRVAQLRGLEDAPFGQVHFAAYPLEGVRYESRSYREAVEIGVQRTLLREISRGEVRAGVASRVQSNGYVDLAPVQADASTIAEAMYGWFVGVAGG